jgi:hypothetical protein
MGGGAGEEKVEDYCKGEDVLDELNKVFGNPKSERYKRAKANNTFGAIEKTKDNYLELIKAYKKAGLVVGPGWRLYLEHLGTLTTTSPDQGQTNIWTIAQSRYNNLLNDVAMSTDVHIPKEGGHVHTKHGTPGGTEPAYIDSPCPLPKP